MGCVQVAILTRGEEVATMRNEFMEEWADRLRHEFPPPQYRVELHALESQLWVVDEATHHIAEIDEDELALVSERDVIETIRHELH
ncbi:MAG: hypothetical protein Kow0056_03990 [Coriobacteriia bacterium]